MSTTIELDWVNALPPADECVAVTMTDDRVGAESVAITITSHDGDQVVIEGSLRKMCALVYEMDRQLADTTRFIRSL